MMSDGVHDVLGEQGVLSLLDQTPTSNPQLLADRLLEKALSLGAEDDCSVIVLRLYAR